VYCGSIDHLSDFSKWIIQKKKKKKGKETPCMLMMRQVSSFFVPFFSLLHAFALYILRSQKWVGIQSLYFNN